MQPRPSTRSAMLLAVASLVLVSACRADPTPAELKLAKGNELYRAADYPGAAAALQESLALDPAQAQAVWDKCSFSWKKAGKLDLAGDTLVKAAATRVKPEEKLANLRNAAGMYLEGRFSDKAEPTFREALKLDPKDTDSLAWLAEILATRGGARKADAPVKPDDLEATLPLYDQLIALAPGTPGNWVNKRIVLGRLSGYYAAQAQTGADAAAKAKMTERAEALKATLDEINKKLPDLIKAAKAGAGPGK